MLLMNWFFFDWLFLYVNWMNQYLLIRSRKQYLFNVLIKNFIEYQKSILKMLLKKKPSINNLSHFNKQVKLNQFSFFKGNKMESLENINRIKYHQYRMTLSNNLKLCFNKWASFILILTNTYWTFSVMFNRFCHFQFQHSLNENIYRIIIFSGWKGTETINFSWKFD
jgi:hypothetical protein